MRLAEPGFSYPLGVTELPKQCEKKMQKSYEELMLTILVFKRKVCKEAFVRSVWLQQRKKE